VREVIRAGKLQGGYRGSTTDSVQSRRPFLAKRTGLSFLARRNGGRGTYAAVCPRRGGADPAGRVSGLREAKREEENSRRGGRIEDYLPSGTKKEELSEEGFTLTSIPRNSGRLTRPASREVGVRSERAEVVHPSKVGNTNKREETYCFRPTSRHRNSSSAGF